jgi:hypothetical protein
MLRCSLLLAALALLATSSCAGPARRAKGHGGVGEISAVREAAWLCRPDRSGDPCATAELASTELAAEGEGVPAPHRPAPFPRADCFYVYPTVDLELVPGNHDDLVDTRRMLATTLAQAARFSEACALWVPLYRQVTLGTYLQPKPILERGLARAFADVERAFEEYLAQADPARPIVLVGHSQGGEMVVRLLLRFFEDDEAMRARLLLAMPIGAEVEVPRGARSGGTLKNIPVCAYPGETGCVVAYRTHAAGEAVVPGRFAPRPSRETVCVNPATLDRARGGDGDIDSRALLSRAYFPVRGDLARALGVRRGGRTPFVVLRDFYSSRCVRGEGGYAYLEVSAEPPPGDRRSSPVAFSHRAFRIASLGLHLLDMQLTQGDLIDLVARRAAALP